MLSSAGLSASQSVYQRLVTFAAAVVVILNSGYYRTLDSFIPLFLLIGLAALLSLTVRTQNQPESALITCLLILLVGIVLSALFNFSMNHILSGGRVAATIIGCYIFYLKLDILLFVKHFGNIMRVVIWLSLILFLWISIGGSLPNTQFDGRYYDFFLVTATGTGQRAMGCFWEPGVFASMIILTMVMEMFFTDKSLSVWRIAVYCVGVLITKSTAGIMLTALLLIAYFWQTAKLSKSTWGNILFACLALVMVTGYELLFQALYELNPEIFGKLLETSSATTSTRLNAPFVNLEIFVSSPVFGHGFTDAATRFAAYMSSSGADKIVAQTSTGTQILSAIGVCGVAYSVMALLPLFRLKKHDFGFVPTLSVSLIMLLITNKEPHIFIAISWIILMMFAQMKRQVSQEKR